MSGSNFETLRVRRDGSILYVQIYRPEEKNTICLQMLREMRRCIDERAIETTIVVIEGLDEVFCSGADFKILSSNQGVDELVAVELFELWEQLASGPYISIAHIKGKANAGGIGFVAACDFALSSERATYGLSELLFGLIPACVLPFLIRKVGQQRSRYMTLTTKTISAEIAHEWGLIDEYAENSDDLLRRHLLRLKLLSPKAIQRCKTYLNQLNNGCNETIKSLAIECNNVVFNDPDNLGGIRHYVETGQFPWE